MLISSKEIQMPKPQKNISTDAQRSILQHLMFGVLFCMDYFDITLLTTKAALL